MSVQAVALPLVPVSPGVRINLPPLLENASGNTITLCTSHSKPASHLPDGTSFKAETWLLIYSLLNNQVTIST